MSFPPWFGAANDLESSMSPEIDSVTRVRMVPGTHCVTDSASEGWNWSVAACRCIFWIRSSSCSLDRAATPAPRQWGRGNHLSARVDHLSGGPDTKDAGLAGGIDSDEAPSSMERLWSPAVATGWQPVANRTVPKNGLDTPKPLPWVTTACREDHMISTSANAGASPEESRRMLRQIGPR